VPLTVTWPYPFTSSGIRWHGVFCVVVFAEWVRCSRVPTGVVLRRPFQHVMGDRSICPAMITVIPLLGILNRDFCRVYSARIMACVVVSSLCDRFFRPQACRLMPLEAVRRYSHGDFFCCFPRISPFGGYLIRNCISTDVS